MISFSELSWSSQTPEGSWEAFDALHALLEEGLGQSEEPAPGPEALGDREDDRPYVEGVVRGREVGVCGGVRDGESRVRQADDAI